MTHYFAIPSSIFISFIIGIICVWSSSGTPAFYQRKQVSVFTRHIRPDDDAYAAYQNYLKKKKGNKCPETEPWPCRTTGQCLSFDFVCDNIQQCDDGFDEAPILCRAKDRPAYQVLEEFLSNHKDLFFPKFFGDHPVDLVAKYLTEVRTIREFKKLLNLTPEQFYDLKTLIMSAVLGRFVDFEMFGLPFSLWPEFLITFKRIADSGFLIDPDTGYWI